MAEAFGVVASALAVIELSAKIVKICAQYTKDVANARQDIEQLQKEVESLGSIAESVRDLSENTPPHKVTTIKKAQPSLDEGRRCLTGLQTKLDPGKRGKYMSRIGLRALKWPFSSKDVEKALADLARLTHAISLAISVDQTTVLLSLEQKTALAKLPIAEGAAYDSHADEHNPQCLEETRTGVLREIAEWARDPSSKAVYWLNGMAGTGKSTISRTIANKFSRKDNLGARLGATFFFKRGEGDRGKMSKFFTTIISQLVQQIPEIAGHVQAAIEADPALISKAMRIQFETLILDPVANLTLIDPPRRTLLFVIDALDECEREKDVQLLIELLSGIPRAMAVQLRFFLTSRPELPIRLGFNSVNGKYRDLILHEVAESIIEHDLQVYLRHELERTRLAFNQGLPEERKLPPSWPNQRDISSLVQMASPLFIFAATICRFVADRKGGSPEKKLRRVLEFRSAQGSRLVATYMPVLEQLTIDLAPGVQGEVLLQFQQIVGPIVVLADPLGSKPLSRLLDIKTNEILELLDFLHSVLRVPLSTEQPIRLLHLSFRDFLVDPARQGHTFWVDQREVHQQLAEQCLRVLNTSLKNDICNVKAPGTLTSSISSSTIRTSIPPELQYACRFWTYHLRESASPNLHMAVTWDFLRSHFLQWLEALSWIGRLPESFDMIKALQSISSIGESYQMTEFLKDSVRFLQAANSSIQIAPLQAYYSSLAFAPSQSIVRRLYEGVMADYIALRPIMPSSWDDRLQTFEVYSSTIKRAVFLSDGKMLGTLFQDGTVILLAADTGERRLRVKGIENSLSSTDFSAFSPDGKLLALVTDALTVTLWHAETGRLQQTFSGHENAIRKIFFSFDSKFLASVSHNGFLISWAVDTGKRRQALPIFLESFHSASSNLLTISPNNELLALTSRNDPTDPTIILWNTGTGNSRHILRGHRAWIHSMEFSPDSRLLASASADGIIILWDTRKARSQRILKARMGPVYMVAFSLDNSLLASASDDGQLILWQTTTGQQQFLKKHGSRYTSSIAFSPNGKLLASSSSDGRVLLCAIESGKSLRTFEGGVHADNCVSFSPDSKRLMATSGHGSISVWAIDMTEREQMPEKHSDKVSGMSFSSDGSLLASASIGGSLMLWRADTGEHRQTLKGHSLRITAIAFSPDKKLLASASVDSTIVLWVVDTGERWQTLEGHTSVINEVVFSPDGKMLATSSHDRTIAIWAVDTGTHLRTLEGRSVRIRSIAFSPNGRMLASVSDDRTVALWGTYTGERLQVAGRYSMRFSNAIREIVFSGDDGLVALGYDTDESRRTLLKIGHNNSSVESDQAALNAVVGQSSRLPALPSVSYSTDRIGSTLTHHVCWICLDGEPILWLPLEYRPELLAVFGHTIAMGFKSGRVLIMRLKNSFLARSSLEIGSVDEI